MKYLKDFIKKYFQNFSYFYRYLGYRIIFRMAFSVSVGFLDGLGLAMFLPLLQMVDGKQQVDQEGLGKLGFLVEGLNNMGIELNLPNVLMVLSVFFILKGLALFINGTYEVTIRQYFIKSIRVSLTSHLGQSSYKAFVLSDAGRIQNTMTGEVVRIATAYTSYFNAFQQVAMVIVYMVFAYFIDAQFALLITIGGIATNLFFRTVYNSTKRASTSVTNGSIVYQGLIIQFVNNFKYLKASGTMRQFNQKLLASIKKIEQSNKKIGQLNTIVTATREPLLIIIVSLVIFLQVSVLGGQLGTILISLLFFYRALSALLLMQTYFNTFLGVSGSMENMTNFQAEAKKNKEKDGNVKIKKFTDKIELRNVGFGYTDKLILKDINLTIERNRTIAFVGESGGGKTTLVNLLVGLMPINTGTMTVDGIDRSVLNVETFQRRIGYITQEPVMFDDSIYNNITFWSEPTPENLKRFERALQQASIEKFISSLPDREHTKLGNNGINLSGGQKQRISIARELFKDIDILVLDEATSALDSETERSIQENIDGLKGNFTILIVAHRLSTIKKVDTVVLLKEGNINALGTYEHLLNTSLTFQNMVNLQEV